MGEQLRAHFAFEEDLDQSPTLKGGSQPFITSEQENPRLSSDFSDTRHINHIHSLVCHIHICVFV